MLDAAETVIRITRDRSRQDLDSDVTLRLAVERGVEIIGEAASKVAADTRDAATGIPWLAIVGMRHRLSHAYFDINHDIVWKTVTDELPELTRRLRHALAAE